MVALGTAAPDFTLPDPCYQDQKSLSELQSDIATVIMFICNHCPFVKHIQDAFTPLANKYIPKGVSFIAINSNDIVNYPEDAPEKMKEMSENLKIPFPYLFDETQEAAKKYHAACTPDFFIYDKNLKLVYRGQFDDSRPGNGIPVTGEDLRNALDAILAGQKPNPDQKPSIGCNIKWK